MVTKGHQPPAQCADCDAESELGRCTCGRWLCLRDWDRHAAYVVMRTGNYLSAACRELMPRANVMKRRERAANACERRLT